MVYPQVVDQQGTLQLLQRIPENTLNNQLWKADNGWSSSLGVSQEATTLHIKKHHKMLQRISNLDAGPDSIDFGQLFSGDLS
jgi:hypothetical protein